MSETAAAPLPQPDSPAFPTLTAEQIELLGQFGEERPTRAGDHLFTQGDTGYDFIVLLEGLIDIVDGLTADDPYVATHGPGRFLGELNLFTGQAVYLTAVARDDGRVLVVPAERLRDVVSLDQQLGNLILQAYLGRRELLQDLGVGLRLIGSRFSTRALELREFVIRNRMPHHWIDLETDAEAELLLRQLDVEPADTPVAVIGTQVLRSPTVPQLAKALGMGTPASMDDRTVYDLIVVGAGPAGLAAGVYGASEGLDTIVIDSTAAGGQAGTSTRIENYLGFPAGVSGNDLAQSAVLQAGRLGAQIVVPRRAVGLSQDASGYVVRCAGGGDMHGRCIVLATGAQYRRLPVDGLERFEGRGVYYAATPAEARLCAGNSVAVVGAGNSAGQAAVFLSRHVDCVHMLVRGETLGASMSRYLIDQIERDPAIDLRLRTEVTALRGHDDLAGVEATTRDGASDDLVVSGLFAFIGADPCTDWLQGSVAMDPKGFILAGDDVPQVAVDACSRWQTLARAPGLLETSLPGVFVVGDARAGSVKRVASSVGDGSLSVRFVHDALSESAAVV